MPTKQTGHLAMLLSLVLLQLLVIPYAASEITFLEERQPLQGTRPPPGSPWPMPKQWRRDKQTLTFTPENLTLHSNLQNCDLVQEAFRHLIRRLQHVQDPSSNDCDSAGDMDDNNMDDMTAKPGNDSNRTRSINGTHPENGTRFDNDTRSDDASSNDASSSSSRPNDPLSNDHNHGQNGNSVGKKKDNSIAGKAHESMPRTVHAHVKDGLCPNYPQLGEQEDYSIEISSAIHIEASSVWGVIWGFETLSQLMYMFEGKWYINKGTIQDEPRFKHRGLLLDTARHFIPVDIIKKNLDAMSTNKLNVFHWHMTDSQSFPYSSIKFPELAQKGAFSSKDVYTQTDVSEIIEYARMRGIRILPEFNTPGHAQSWGKAMPDLLTPCWANGKPNQANLSYYAVNETVDPSKNSTFEFLSEFFQEIKDVFADKFLHMGMDGANFMCWASNPDIAAFMSSIGLLPDDFRGLQHHYNRRLLNIVHGLDRRTIVWEDAIDNGAEVPNNTVIQVWKDASHSVAQTHPWQSNLQRALRAGYEVIFSSCWYLSKPKNGQDWKDFYACDPANINATEEERTNIMGGEAITWTEYLDETNLLQTVWPRAAAVAERLWSSAKVNTTEDAAFRLDQHRCRMVRQGISAQPILPGYCHDDYNTDNAIMSEHNPAASLTPPSTPVPINPRGRGEKRNSAVRMGCSTNDAHTLLILCICFLFFRFC